jgi:hypothetical protein
MDGAPAAAGAPAAVEDRGVDPGIDANRIPAARNRPTGRTATAAGGRCWVRSTAQPSAVNAEAEAVLDHAAWNIGDQSAVAVSAAGPRGSPPASLPCGRLLVLTGERVGGARRLAPPQAAAPAVAAVPEGVRRQASAARQPSRRSSGWRRRARGPKRWPSGMSSRTATRGDGQTGGSGTAPARFTRRRCARNAVEVWRVQIGLDERPASRWSSNRSTRGTSVPHAGPCGAGIGDHGHGRIGSENTPPDHRRQGQSVMPDLVTRSPLTGDARKVTGRELIGEGHVVARRCRRPTPGTPGPAVRACPPSHLHGATVVEHGDVEGDRPADADLTGGADGLGVGSAGVDAGDLPTADRRPATGPWSSGPTAGGCGRAPSRRRAGARPAARRAPERGGRAGWTGFPPARAEDRRLGRRRRAAPAPHLSVLRSSTEPAPPPGTAVDRPASAPVGPTPGGATVSRRRPPATRGRPPGPAGGPRPGTGRSGPGRPAGWGPSAPR